MKALLLSLTLVFLAPAAGAAGDADPFASMAKVLPASQHAERGPVLTLEQLEAAALANNPELKVWARRVGVADARIGPAGALEDASLMYRGWGVPLARPWSADQAQNMFMVQQALPGPGKRRLRSELATKDSEMARAFLETRRQAVLARVRKAYYELLRNREELRVHDEQAALARQAMEAARVKYTVGRVPQQDVLRAQVALTRLLDHLYMLQQNAGLAQAELNALMGRDIATAFTVAGGYELPASLPSSAELLRRAAESRPELRAAALAVRRAELGTELAGKAYTPDFMVGGGYMLMPAGSMRRHAYMVEASINLPWLNRRRHDGEIAAAQAEAALEQAELDNEHTLAALEIQQALVRARTAWRLAELYEHTLRPQARATFQSVSIAYQNDRTDFLSLIDSQNTLLEIETGYFRVLGEFEARWAELERAVGSSIPRTVARAVAKEVQ